MSVGQQPPGASDQGLPTAGAAPAHAANTPAAVPHQTDANVITSFRLGWLLAAFYNNHDALAAEPPPTPAATPKQLPDSLPGLSELPARALAQLRLAEVRQARKGLTQIATTASVALVDTGALEAALNDPTKHADDRRAEIYLLHESLFIQLTSINSSVGYAYGLGRALADTSLLPDNADGLKREFQRDRTAVLSAWLDDLDQSFPQYSAFAVKAALHAWVEWAEAPRAAPRRRQIHNPLRRARPVTLSGKTEKYAIDSLRRQGKIWFSMLASETPPSQFLIPENYVDAAGRLVRRSGHMAWSLLRGWWLAVGLAIAAVATGIWAATTYLNGSSQTAAVIVAILSGTGLSWKGVGATLGSAATKLEGPLWDAEVESAIALATMRVPWKSPVG